MGADTSRDGKSVTEFNPFYTAHRRGMLAHCISLIDRAGEEYATWAAHDYERNSPMLLEGLARRIEREIERRKIESKA